VEGDIFGPQRPSEVLTALTVQKDRIIGECVVAPITTEVQKVQATEAWQVCQQFIKQIDAKDDQFCKPLYDHWKLMKSEFAKLRKPVEQVAASLQAALSERRRVEADAVRAEQARLNAAATKRFEKAQASGKGTVLPVPVASVVQDTGKRVETAEGTVVWIDNYVPRIVDETKIPREYLMPDMAKLKAACKAGIEVPGVERVNEPYARGSR